MERENEGLLHQQPPQLQPRTNSIGGEEEKLSERSFLYSDRQSISFLSESKGGILQNPDGTLQVMKPVSVRDLKKVQEKEGYGSEDQSNDSSLLSFQSIPANQVLLPLYSSPTHPFFIPFAALPSFVDSSIDLFVKHNLCFLLFLLVQMLIEVIFQYLAFHFRQNTLNDLSKVYDKVEPSLLNRTFIFLYVTNIVYLCAYYLLGIIASLKKSYHFFNYFSVAAIVGLSLEIILSYVDEFNVMIFFLRVIGYVYSKFLSYLLLQLLLLPH